MSKKDRNAEKRIEKELLRKKAERKKKVMPIIFGGVLLAVAAIIGGTMLSKSYDASQQQTEDLYANQVTVAAMEEKVAAKEDFFAYFYQPNCEYCKLLSPTLIPMAKEMNEPVYPVNIFNRKETWDKYSVTGTPTVIHFKDGKEVERIVGTQSEDTLKTFLSK